MKNEEKAEKMLNILKENNSIDLVSDTFVLQQMKGLTEDIIDKKLQIRLEDFLENVIKEFAERDLDEESKTEFYCSSCYKFLPIDKKANFDTCEDCLKEQEEEEDFE